MKLLSERSEGSDAATGNLFEPESIVKELARFSGRATSRKLVSLLRKPLKISELGLVTDAEDDDPSGIVTGSSLGASFGPSTLWTMPVVCPLNSFRIIDITDCLGRDHDINIAKRLAVDLNVKTTELHDGSGDREFLTIEQQAMVTRMLLKLG